MSLWAVQCELGVSLRAVQMQAVQSELRVSLRAVQSELCVSPVPVQSELRVSLWAVRCELRVSLPAVQHELCVSVAAVPCELWVLLSGVHCEQVPRLPSCVQCLLPGLRCELWHVHEERWAWLMVETTPVGLPRRGTLVCMLGLQRFGLGSEAAEMILAVGAPWA